MKRKIDKTFEILEKFRSSLEGTNISNNTLYITKELLGDIEEVLRQEIRNQSIKPVGTIKFY